MYRIIGDIHGRTAWKGLVDPYHVNVFVGDYFDPYADISFEDLKENFLKIIQFKDAFPDKVVLLLGNHDLHYWWHTGKSDTSRFMYEHSQEIHDLFMEHKDKFQIAYSIENKVIVTHAGVSKPWYNTRIGIDPILQPDELASNINDMFKHDRQNCFSFSSNCNFGDYYGNSPQQSCVWIRPESLYYNNLYEDSDVIQVVGHTQMKEVGCDSEKKLYFIDCLGTNPQCLVVNKDEDGNFQLYDESAGNH